MITALLASRTRKKITALTLTDTLSRVITSWGGTSMVMVRRLTFTILSMNGISSTRPGPEPSPPGLMMALARRPKRKITPRSYSRRMRTDEARTNITMTMTGTMAKISPKPSMSCLLGMLCPPRSSDHLQREAVHAQDLDALARGHRAVLRHRPPQFAVHQDLPLRIERPPDHTGLADHARGARGLRPVEGPEPRRHGEDHQARGGADGRDDDEPGDAEPG